MQLLLSSLFGATGGIPAFNRLLTRAAVEFAAEKKLPLHVVALTDPQDQLPPGDWLATLDGAARAGLEGGWYRPCGGSRSRCIRESGRRRGEPLLVGHVNLAPLGALLGSRFAVIAHGTEVWSPLAWHRRLALQRATAVGCVSDHTAGCVVRVQGVAAGRCQRLVNAVERLPDLAILANSDGDSPPASPSLQLLSVTRLVPGEPKGIELVLRALAELPLLGDASYVVVGDGPARPVLRQLADALGLGQRVYFAGGVDDGERDRLLAGCDLFVLPSSNEGFGIVYLEAMAHAKPCLAARVGGAPEVVLDEQTGLLVEPAVALVASALQRLSDPALRRRLGQAGRQRVEQHFTYAAFRRHAFALFTSLLAP